MGPVKNPSSTQARTLQITSKTAIKLLLLTLVIVAVPLALSQVVNSTSQPAEPAKAESPVMIHAAGRGKPYLNLQDGRKVGVDYRGDSASAEALRVGAAQPRALATADFDRNGTPDVVAGYALNGTGLVTIQRGNPDAFAPADDSVFVRMQQGYNPPSLLPVADVYAVPVPVDFLVTGNFSTDSVTDVLVAVKGGGLYLLTGDGNGRFDVPRQVILPGAVTALGAGEFRAADGITDVAVGVSGPDGETLMIFDGATGGLSEAFVQYRLSAPATAVEFGGLDEDPFLDVAVASGSEVLVVHGWGRKEKVSAESRLERINVGASISGLAVGAFQWDRKGLSEIAALTSDGTVNIVSDEQLDTRPFTEAEAAERNRGKLQLKGAVQDVETVQSWRAAKAGGWTTSSSFAGNSFEASAASHKPLLKTNLSYRETEDLMLVDGSQRKIGIMRRTAPVEKAINKGSVSEDVMTASLDVESAPVAVLPLPRKLNGFRDVVVLSSGTGDAIIVENAPNTTITVDRTDDPSGAGLTAASVCDGNPNNCSLRGAMAFANNLANNNTTISIPANTYILSINGASVNGCGDNTTGDVSANQSMTIMGAGAATTIIRQTGTGPANDGDRIMCMNETFLLNLVYNFSGVTFSGGRDGDSNGGTPDVFGGGGIIGGEKDNSLTLTSVTFVNNQATQTGLGGGGLQITGGNLNVVNCTFGGTSAPAAYTDRSSLTGANSTGTSGGGLTYTPSAPQHTGGTGLLTVTGTTFTRNVANSISAGGGGADLLIFAFGAPGGIGSGSASFSTSTFTNNSAPTANGGGIVIESLPTTVASSSFNNNSAGNRGGAIYLGGGSLLLNGTTPSITMSGNTATNAGSSVSTAAPVTVSGTNTTIGGSIEVGQNGTWTNNAGSALAPTDVAVPGGTFNMNDSTMNVSGNLTLGPGGTVGGTFNGNTGTVNIQGNLVLNTGGTPTTTFNGGTGTFNFNGTGSQSISGALAPTFGNLTDSNVNNPLTVSNNSIVVTGNLTVIANAILAPGASTVISGAGTLTGNGTARVTRTGANAFLSQYTLTGKTLTNLTVEYIGAAAQGVSPTTYGPLKINNASGVSLDSGTTTVNGLFTLTAGQFNVGNSPRVLVLNNGTSVVGGTLTSGADGTVNYNQSSDGQAVIAATYGHLTFSNFNKVLAGTGTIFVAGTFTPGTAVGHTIAGSTINFNGTGAQTIPAFNYFNLSTATARGVNNITLVNGGTIGIAGAFSPLATFAGGGYVITNNTVNYNGATSQTIAAFNYNNLTSSNVGARTLQNGGTIGIAGVFTPGTNSYTVTNSTVNFNGAGAQNINAFNYHNLTSSNAGARTLPNGGTVGIAGAFTPGANAYTITGSTIDYNGSGSQTITAFNYNNLTSSNVGTRTLANSGTIGIAEVFTPGSNTYTITGSTINFNGSGSQTIPAFNYNNLTSSSTGARTLPNTGIVGIAGVFTPGTNVYTITGSTVEYNGTSAQTMPAAFTTYNNLNLNNAAGVTGFAGLTVQGLLNVKSGTFTSSSAYNNVQIDATATLTATAASTINVSGNWTNNGAFNASTGTVVFNGSGGQSIAGSSATAFNNLTIANTGSGVSLGQNATVNGTLTLNSDLTTGANILTQPGTAPVSAGAFDVVGNSRRTGAPLPTAVALTFGNLNNRITFAAVGTTPTEVTVNLVKAAPGSFTSAVQRTYTITPTGGSGFSGTLRLRYLDSELNGNVESLLDLWRFNGSAFVDEQQTQRDSINNWVEKSGVTTFSPWTLATHVNAAPNVTNATTVVNAQTTSGLVVTANVVDGAAVTHFKITGITGGSLFKNDGVTAIVNDQFITLAEGNAGLKFTPTTNSVAAGSFNVQSSSDALGTGLSPAATATITVNQAATTTTITLDDPDPSATGAAVTVNFTVTVNSPSSGTPTGNVVITVNDASGDTCSGTVAAGTCSLTLTTAGSKTLTATYAGDTLFTGSNDTELHEVNGPPVAVDDNYSSLKGSTLTIGAPGVLANDTGSPTDVTEILGGATTAGGTVDLGADGSFVYNPPSASFTGADSFTYTANNAFGSDSGTVNINVVDAFFINEVLFDPPGTDAPNEYIELRGPASATIPAGTYLVAIEGDSAENPGDVQTIINLSGLSFGSNGFLVLLQNGNTYTTAAGTTVLTSTTAGFGGLPGAVFSADAAATDLEDSSVSFLLIQSGTAPTLTDDIDTDDNGSTNAPYSNWTVVDSIGALNAGANVRGYAAYHYRNVAGTGSSIGTETIVNFIPSYVGRNGDSIGATAADWVTSGGLAGTAPNFTLNATDTEPIAFANQPLNHIGATNFDISPPSVTSITRANANPTNATSVDFTVTFSETVTGVGTGDFTLTTTGTIAGASISLVGGMGNVFTVSVNTGTGDGTIRLDLIDDNSIIDGSNNPLGGAGVQSFTTGEVYNIDKTIPTVDITDVTPDPRGTSVSSISIVFSEAVAGFDLADLTLTHNGGSNLLTGSQTLTSGDNVNWTLGNLSTITSSDGTYVLTLTAAGSLIEDTAGNDLAAGASDTWVKDGSLPTADITDVSPDPRNTAVSSIAIVFSEAVTGFDLADLSLTRNGGANLLTGAQTLTSGDNITWTLGNLSGLTGTDGTYLLTLTAAGSGIQDGGANALSGDATDSWVMDTAGPTVTINQEGTQSDPTSTSPINFTVVFSESVNNFATGDVALSGTAGATTANVTGSGTTYNVAVSGMTSSGSVTAALNAGVASDALGNLSASSTSTDNTVTFNLITNNAPVLDITGIFSLNAIDEDISPASNTGTLISDIIASAGGNRITDADPGAVEGIAISDVDSTNGAWEFTINNGTNWISIGTPDPTDARLLAADANTRLRFIPNANFNGSVNPGILFRAWDQTSGSNGGTANITTNGGQTAFSAASDTASITVNAVNDPPSFTKGADQVVGEDAGAQTVPGWATGISAGPADESGQTLTFLTSTNNDSLFAVLPAVSPTGTLTYTPAANASGVVTVNVALQDNGGGTDTSPIQTFTITINAVNDPPTANAQSVNTNEDTPLGITLTGSDPETPSGSLIFTVTAQPTNGVLSGSGANLTYTPNANFNGADSFTFTVTDTGTPALTSAEATVSITVDAVNDGPTNTVPGAQATNTNTALIFSAGNGNQISIADSDAGSNAVQVTLTGTNGTVTLSGTGGLLFSVGDGTADATMTFTGTIADINTALNGLAFAPTSGFSGAASLQIVTNDQGNTGSGGALSDTDSVNITVTSGGALQFSSATYTVNEDGVFATITVNRTGGTAGTTTVDFATSNGSATSGSDYTSSSGTLTFGDGVTSQGFTVPILNDVFDELDETVNLTLSTVTGTGVLGTPSTADLTITDNDATPTITINDVAVTEGNAGTTNAEFTVTLSAASGLPVTLNYSTADGTAVAPGDYQAIASTLLTFNPGETSKNVTVVINGDTAAEVDETYFVNLSNATNTSILDNQGQGTILNDDAPQVQFDAASYSVNEGSGQVTITLTRTGNLTQAFSVDYETLDRPGVPACEVFAGLASERCDYATTLGTLTFASGQTSATIIIPIVNDVHVEGAEVFDVKLSNAVGAVIGGPTTETVTIVDNDTVFTQANPIDTFDFHVRMLYRDFLTREPDGVGFPYWTGRLTSCAANPACSIVQERIQVSAGFFYSNEFLLRKGYFIFRFYRASLGRRPTYREFFRDMQSLGQIDAEEELKRTAFTNNWVTRAEFITLYGGLTDTNFVNKLADTANVALDRPAMIAELGGGKSRAQLVRDVVENALVYDKYFREAFVTTNYFGFLRREPDATGFAYWMNRVNQHPNDFRLEQHPEVVYEVVGGFLYSEEYQRRFGNRNY